MTGQVSNLVVIDIDPRHKGETSWKQFTRTLVLKTTLEVKTGGGGTHLYYKMPQTHITNRTNLLPGVDVRASGGYIVAPGSLHQSGLFYEWANDVEIAELPEAFPKLNHTNRFVKIARITRKICI